jgi:hypothetical protein
LFAEVIFVLVHNISWYLAALIQNHVETGFGLKSAVSKEDDVSAVENHPVPLFYSRKGLGLHLGCKG